MRRCLQLAALGREKAQPNPMVGSVVVHEGKIIGEGYHHQCGFAHAEVNAINSVKDQSLLTSSTIYVNLEPCAHVGRTPACATLIADRKIPRVVIGCVDSFAKVSGKGIKMLKASGAEVTVGVLEEKCLQFNKRFFTFHQKKRPYIILKWAKTKDNFIDHDRTDLAPDAAWITNELSRSMVHKWRTQETAFLVGTHTALKDNPQLNVRAWTGQAPIRITVDREGVFPDDLNLLDDSVSTLVFSNKEAKKPFIRTAYIKIDNNISIEKQILNELYQREVQSIVIEGGQLVLDSFITQNLWDEARVFTGNKEFCSGTKAPAFHENYSKRIILDDTELRMYYNQ